MAFDCQDLKGLLTYLLMLNVWPKCQPIEVLCSIRAVHTYDEITRTRTIRTYVSKDKAYVLCVRSGYAVRHRQCL